MHTAWHIDKFIKHIMLLLQKKKKEKNASLHVAEIYYFWHVLEDDA